MSYQNISATLSDTDIEEINTALPEQTKKLRQDINLVD